MNMEQYLIPKHLDAPPMFLIVEADTAVCFLFPFCIGFIFEQLLLFVVVGLLVARHYARFKAEGGRGVFIELLYWYTPSRVWLSKAPPAHLREYLG